MSDTKKTSVIPDKIAVVDYTTFTQEQLIAELQAIQKQSQTDKENFDQKEADLQEEVNLLKADNATLQSVNDALSKKFDEIDGPKTMQQAAAKIAEVKVTRLPAETFEVDGEKYKFISPVFMYKKERIVAADVINDTAKLAELVAAKHGCIKKV